MHYKPERYNNKDPRVHQREEFMQLDVGQNSIIKIYKALNIKEKIINWITLKLRTSVLKDTEKEETASHRIK